MISTTRRSRAKRGEGEKLRDEILDVAEKLLIEGGGEDAVSIRAIADACGCSPPSIYLHFADKDELFLQVCERRFAELDRYSEEAGSSSDDPLESLRLRGRAYIRFGLDHPEHYRLLMMTPKTRSPEDLSPLSPGILTFQHLVDAVHRCIEAGVFPEQPGAGTVALALWAGVHGITSLLINFPTFAWGDIDELIDFILDVQVEGLLGA